MKTKELVKFLKELKANNEKSWFDENRDRYKKLRDEFVELVGELIFAIGGFDRSMAVLEPKRCLFRINRDIRFSKNKSPYKTQFSAAFAKGGKKTGNPMYYFHINADGELFTAAGIYCPTSDQLWDVRSSIARNPEKIYDVIEEPKFKKAFDIYDIEKLKTAPQGFTRDHPEIELLRLKHYVVKEAIKVNQLKGDLAGHVVESFKKMSPLVDYLNEVTSV